MTICLIGPPTVAEFGERDAGGIAPEDAARIMAEHAPLGVLSLASVLENHGLAPTVADLNQLYYEFRRQDGERRGEAIAASTRPANGNADFARFAAEALVYANGEALAPAVFGSHGVAADGRDSSAFVPGLFAANASASKTTVAEIFGFSTLCSSYPLVLRIAGQVKRLRPQATIVLGGPQASVVDVATLRAFPFIDVIVRGEAEESFPQLVRAIQQGKSAAESALNSVPGITFRRGGDGEGEIVRNPDAPLIADLDNLPFPAWHLLPAMSKDGRGVLPRFVPRFLPLELGRGCPFACTFCSTNDFFRRRYRLKSPARVLAEMRRLHAAYGVDTFDLVHDMFTVDRKRVVAFCRAMLNASRADQDSEKFYWGCSARTDCIDDELIALMAEAGCRGIFFGIETGSERMQKIIDKGLDLQESRARVRACSRAGIKTAVSLIAGFPQETMDDLRDTVALFMESLASPLADPQLCILAPLAETPIHRQNRERLQLDDPPIDMSYRGWDQEAADRELILARPEIFPNFYTVPAPFLDHEFLKELRDFLLNGSRSFRQLLLQLHEVSGDILEIFTRWRQWRAENKGGFPGDDRSAYYAREAFPEEFLEFVEEILTAEARRGAEA